MGDLLLRGTYNFRSLALSCLHVFVLHDVDVGGKIYLFWKDKDMLLLLQ